MKAKTDPWLVEEDDPVVTAIQRFLGQKVAIGEADCTMFIEKFYRSVGLDVPAEWRMLEVDDQILKVREMVLEHMYKEKGLKLPENFAKWTDVDKREFIDEVRYSWGLWARPAQLIDTTKSFVTLMLSGRGFGKSRSGSEWVRERALADPGAVILVAAPRYADVKNVIIEGQSGLLAICGYREGREEIKRYNKNDLQLEFFNGSKIVSANGESEDSFRGFNLNYAWVDELASIRNASEAMNLGLVPAVRIGKNPHILITTTPKPTPVIKELVESADKPEEGSSRPYVRIVAGSTFDNAANLSRETVEQFRKKYDGTRAGRQELYGELLLDVEGAVLNQDQIEAVMTHELPTFMQRILIGVDPAVTYHEKSDRTGIVVFGLGDDYHGYVLWSEAIRAHPEIWGQRVKTLYEKFGASDIVIERNMGGNLVSQNMKMIDPMLPVHTVHATGTMGSKMARFEPLATLITQHRIHFYVGPDMWDRSENPANVEHVDLIADLTRFTGNRKDLGGSPDILDAFVWAGMSAMRPVGTAPGEISFTNPDIHLPRSQTTTKHSWESLGRPGGSGWAGPRVGR
jgi:phage terminase large subunit-like protein